MQKIIIIFVFSVGLLSSCAVSKDTLSKEDLMKELDDKLSAIGRMPDSLRSAEDKMLARKHDYILHERITHKDNGKQELTISREEMKAMGLPELLYDLMKNSIDRTNKWYDEHPEYQDSVWIEANREGFRRWQEDYLERKRLNPDAYKW